MLTPRFRISQNEEYIYIYIQAPYVKFSEAEIDISGNDFAFYCKPYLLRLYLSGEVVEDGREHADYFVDDGEFEIRIPKLVKGEHFENLDMITKLMTPSSKNADRGIKAQTLIQVIEDNSNAANLEEYDDDDIDWTVEQVPVSSDLPQVSPLLSYGFNEKASNVFVQRQEELCELLDVAAPDTTPIGERASLQLEHVQESFSADYYIGDLIEDDNIIELIHQELETVASFLGGYSYSLCLIYRIDHLLSFLYS